MDSVMRRRRLIIFGFIVLTSCNLEYKTCDFDSPDEQVRIYSHVLNELVERHFYNFYLGQEEERIFKLSTSDNPDTAKIEEEVTQLQNEIFHDSAKFCNVFLDTTLRREFNPWTYYVRDTSSYATQLKKVIRLFSDEGGQVIDSLNSMQERISPKDFHLCTSRVLSLADIRNHENKCVIGVVSFSKVFLEKSGRKGILYYSFRCGGLCGKGELLIIEKVKNRWTIVDGMIMWIS
ncbi:MAG: hypothetical protein QM762_13710 [Chryseolinea sp.]